MKRVVVLGTSGAGKSVFSEELARIIGAIHIDRDRLWSDSVPMESPRFRANVERAISVDAWVFDGMPYYVEELVLRRADTVVCLDFTKRVVMSRVIRRSLKQSLLRQQVGVHSPRPFKDWRKPDDYVRWAWSTHRERHEQMREWSKRQGVSHLKWIFLKSPKEAEHWLDRVRANSSSRGLDENQKSAP